MKNGPPDSPFKHLFLEDQTLGLHSLVSWFGERDASSHPVMETREGSGRKRSESVCDLPISQKVFLWLPGCLFQ